MSGSWPKVIRDPVHNIIAFEDRACDRLLLDLINTKEFQRLRRIKQLGVSELVFPGANHSRFAHSIGVMHAARAFLAKVRRVQGDLFNADHEPLVLAAALIHDVGHGPFSHAFESITGEKHEARTLEIIQDGSTDLHARLKAFDPDFPDRLAVFFDEATDDVQLTAAEVPRFLTQVVSSQLDADRFDYLLRDSAATGADYGRFDLKWLIHHLQLDTIKGRFYLSRKALSAAEDYVFARYHMYRTVYFHKTTRAAEVMLRLLFRRAKQLVEQTGSPEEARNIIPDAPPSVLAAFSGPLSLGQYLALDDHSMTEFLKASSVANDPDGLLQALASGLLHRKLFKAVDATGATAGSVARFRGKVVGLLTQRSLDPDFYLADDDPSDTPYKPYDPDAERPATQIYIETEQGGQAEISSKSDAIDTLKKKFSFLRYYFPEDLRSDVDALARDTLR
jgi:HD superfamily phosphohydrolase